MAKTCVTEGGKAFVFIIRYWAQAFAKAVRQSSPCFAYVDLSTLRAGYAMDQIYGDAWKVVCDLSRSIG